ncbi:hypothetical protein PYW07_012001 [Mythimna separata]|uniref:C2H2-type domain-containing protein n=1 Tax=Mythimna separata TaxID=271217 RepID=A0AAD7YLG2_MYTSE|nr:hypothetical protein PYW07_012001 [Mythimna separata]
MTASVEVRCIVCQLVFCCADCRRRHERVTHGLTYDCPICRGFQFLCKPEELNQDFIRHLTKEHTPLHCKKCHKVFYKMEDFFNIDKCTSITEILGKEAEVGNTQIKELNEKFDSIYEKANKYGENFEGIISVNKHSKTAIITPIVRKKYLVDYESSDSEDEKSVGGMTPHPQSASKTPRCKRQRAATPHTKKLLGMMRQKVVEEYDETTGDDIFDGSPKTTPVRTESNLIPDPEIEMTTPTSHMPHLLKLAQIVTTSTPTHPAANGWPLFADQGADSPLSEIETTEGATQSMNIEPSKSDLESLPKLKSIIVTGSKIRIGSQDSTEKHVTFQDSNEGSIKTKKVKFADDTVFEPPKVKRVFRKPKRMLTPGPQKPKFSLNPRFQALINRFENQGMIMARTPKTREKNTANNDQESTPPVGEPSTMPARAINFKEDSPQIESEYSKESNELFKTCIDTPEVGINAISALTTNIAGSLQNCLSSVLMNTEDATEIQFKFVITKRKVSVKRLVEECEDRADEKSSVIDKNLESIKENIWSSVARAVKNVFWGEQSANFATTTPHRSFSFNSSSSSSKRKCDELSDTESPVNHKRHKYEGRIRGRPPLRRSKTCVASLRSSMSAEQKSLINELSRTVDENMNLSF